MCNSNILLRIRCYYDELNESKILRTTREFGMELFNK
jgi:hypothetical protein